MYVNSTLRILLVLGAVSLVAVAGLIGFTHKAHPVSQASANVQQAVEAPAAAPVPMNAYGEPEGNPAPAAAVPAPAPAAPVMRAAVPVRPVMVRSRRRMARRRYYRRGRRVVVVRRRPWRHSAAIVAGSAAGGALIGGLAGGGKGAGIGALAGGAGGLVYDRLTHKKRVVVRR